MEEVFLISSLQLQLLRPFVDEHLASGKDFDINEQEDLAIYCGGGTRSRIAYSLLKNKGYTKLTNINGGWAALSKTGIKLGTRSAGKQCNLV